MAFNARDLMIAVLPPDSCDEFTQGGPPCPAFSEIPPAPNTPHCPPPPPCPAFSEIPPPCPGASLGGPSEGGDTGESALAALRLQLREALPRTGAAREARCVS